MLNAVNPDWEKQCIQNPPGNTLGAGVRAIHEDTKSIFGQSVYSSDKAKARRWKSTYKGDFSPLAELRKELARKAMEEKEEKPRSAPTGVRKEDAAGGERSISARSMFASWKIPERLTASGTRRCQAMDPDVIKSSDIPTPLLRSKTEFPDIHGGLNRPQRIATAGDLSVCSGRKSGRASVKSAVLPGPVPSSARPSNTRKPKQLRTDMLLGKYYQPGQAKSAAEYLHNATDPGSFAIKKALQQIAQDKNSPIDHNLQKWLLTADHQDRAVALDFFQSLTDSKLLGEAQEQRNKINTIVNLLKCGKGEATKMASLHGVHAQSLDDGNLRHVRLLTPHTRGSKWMHQTWHHLPNYPDVDPVNNRSAIYTEPHKIASRHFVIHPDWG